MDDCFGLKEQIDDLIQRGQLKKYVLKNVNGDKHTNDEQEKCTFRKSQSQSPGRHDSARDTTRGKNKSE